MATPSKYFPLWTKEDLTLFLQTPRTASEWTRAGFGPGLSSTIPTKTIPTPFVSFSKAFASKASESRKLGQTYSFSSTLISSDGLKPFLPKPDGYLLERLSHGLSQTL